MKNIDIFKNIVGLVFGQLYDNFPLRTNLDVRSLANSLCVDVTEIPDQDENKLEYGYLENGEFFPTFLDGVLDWLAVEGFIRTDRTNLTWGVVLTSKGFIGTSAIASDGTEALGEKMAGYKNDSHTGMPQVQKGQVGTLIGWVGEFFGGFSKPYIS